MHLTDDFITQWEHIVADVNKTDVPIECLKKIVIKLQGGKQRSVNIHTLMKQGMDSTDIEMLVSKLLNELDPIIRDVDFVIDIKSVASLIQPLTDKLLKQL